MAALLVGARFAINTDFARRLITDQINAATTEAGLRVSISGLTGDPLTAPKIQRLTLMDPEGAFLHADAVSLAWRPLDLLGGVVRIDTLSARRVDVQRTPHLAPTRRQSHLSLDIRAAHVPEIALGATVFGFPATFSADGALERGRGRAFLAHARLARTDNPLDKAVIDAARDGAGRLTAKIAAEGAPGGVFAALLHAPKEAGVKLGVQIAGDSVAGEFTAAIDIGAAKALAFAGAWTKDRVSARGTADLAAAPVLRPWAARLGGPAQLVLDAPRDGRSQGGLAVTAPNATLQLTGALPRARLEAPQAVTLDLRTARLSRLAPDMGFGQGPARLAGVARRVGASWSFDGDITTQNLQAPHFQAGRVSGPLEIKPSREGWRVQTTLTAEGAQIGPRTLAGAIGPRPVFEADAVLRETDRRLTLRRFQIRGADAQAAGEGYIDLPKGLISIDAKLDVARFTRVSPDLSGSASATLGLRRASRAEALLIRLEGAGRNTQKDPTWGHFVGGAPRFAFQGRFAADTLTVERAVFEGSNLRAAARGRAAVTGMDLKIEATMRGPFRIGPYDASGEVDAFGTVFGPLEAPKLDLEAHVDALEAGPAKLADLRAIIHAERLTFPLSANGRLTARTPRGPLAAKGAVTIRDGRAFIEDIDADWAGLGLKGRIALGGVQPMEGVLRVQGAAGALLNASEGVLEGSLQLAPRDGRQGVVFLAQGRDVLDQARRVLARRIDISVNGTMEALTLDARVLGLAGDTPFDMEIKGPLRQSDGQRSAALEIDGRYAEARFKSFGPLTIEQSGDVTKARGAFNAAGGRLTLSADAETDRLSINVDLDAAPAALARLIWPDAPLQGALSGRASVSGAGQSLTGRANIVARGIAPEGDKGEGLDIQVDATMNTGRLKLSAIATGQSDFDARLTADLPMRASARPFLLYPDMQAGAHAEFRIRGEVAALWRFIGAPEQRVTGRLSGQGVLKGTLARPELTGAASLAAATFEDDRIGLRLTNVSAEGVFDGPRLAIQRLRAEDGSGGTATASGAIEATARGLDWNISANLAKLAVLGLPDFAARGTGPASYRKRPGEAGVLGGDLVLDEATLGLPEAPSRQAVAITVTHKNRPIAPDRAARFGNDPPTRYDISLTAPGRVVTRGRGLDSEWSMTGRLTGSTVAPLLTGQARLLRGTYDIVGRRFDLEDSRIVFSGPLDRPRLDLTAVRVQEDYTVTIAVTGDARAPSVTVRSNPALPQDEALSRALFARSAAQLSPLDAAELTAALAALAGGDRFSVARALGLDRLNLAQTADGAVVTGGRRLSKDVYAEVSGGARGWSGAQIEWTPRPRLSLVSRFGGEGDARIAVRWRRDY